MKVRLLVLIAASLGFAQPDTAPDLILHNARVYTGDPARPLAEAVAIRGDRLVQVGTNKDALALGRSTTTRVIDVRGATIVPGFQDAHGHVEGLGASMRNIDLRGTTSYQQVVDLVRRRVGSTRPGEWILGRNWDQNDWSDTSWPTYEALSAVAPDTPVYLTRVDGHAGLANRRAMELAGINASTADPPGGRILRGPGNEPSGVFIDNAQSLVSSKIPPVSRAQLEDHILLADAEMRRLGLTMVHDAGADGATVDAYKRLIEAGRLKTRLYVMLRGSARALQPFFQKGPELDKGRHRLIVRAVKIVADGALGSRGAALLEPYADEPATTGLLTTAPDEVYAQTLAASKAGFQPAIHAIGDRANRIVMDVFERVQREVPGSRALRMRNEHAQILDVAEIPRFARLGVIASMQATHATSDMPWAPARIGPARVDEGAYVWRKLLASGATIANGSDFPVEQPNPLLGFYAAITRQDPRGAPPGGWTPGQRMSRNEALASLTRHAAFAAHAETLTGSLEVGKLADLVVLSKDIMRVPPADVLSTRVRMTIVGGEIVHDTP